MGAAVDKDLHSLLVYYGEPTESGEGTHPEDFFALVMSFSSALNVRDSTIPFVFLLTLSYRKPPWKSSKHNPRSRYRNPEHKRRYQKTRMSQR